MKYIVSLIILTIMWGILINFSPQALSAIKTAQETPLESPKTIQTPFIPPFIYDFVKTSLASTTSQLELKDLPDIIKNIYNTVIEWYNNVPQEKKDKIYQKIELIALALLKAIFDLLEQ